MAYSDLILKEGIDQQFMVILYPRRIPTNFTVLSGSVYQSDFDYGEVSGVTVDGVSLTAGSSTSLSAGEWYWDYTVNKLYVRTSGGTDPDTHTTVATYKIYCATKDEHWYSDPLDSTKRMVYYDPVVGQSMQIKSSVSDNIYGLYPVDTSQLVLINAEHIFEKHLYDSSFNSAQIKMYHVLKTSTTADLEIANIKLIYDGVMGNATYTQSQITIQCLSAIDELETEYRNEGDSFFDSTTFPSVDEQFIGFPIRYVYGVVDGYVPVNIDFVDEAPTTSDNRDWVVIGEQTNLANITTLVAASPASTATRTYVASAQGLRVGDQVWMDRVVGTDEYKQITVVNYGSNYIEHTALSGGAMASGDAVKRSFVGSVTIVQNEIVYEAQYNRDYTTATFAGGTSGFSFTTTMEANLTLAATLSPTDRVYCRVYGRTNDLTISAAPFGSNDSESGNITKPAMIIYDLLKRVAGIPESRINTASFTAVNAVRTDAFGFAIPQSSSDSFPTIKTIIAELLQMGLLRIFPDDDNLYKIAALSPITSNDYSIEDDEILKGSFSYEFNYNELVSEVIVEYAYREINSNFLLGEPQVTTATATNTLALYLHGIEKSKTYPSHHFKEAEAQTLADRFSFIFGDRLGTVNLSTKNRFFPTEINEVIEVSRTKLPGFEFDADTNRTRDLSVTQTVKGLRQVGITLDDMKGITDNSGSW